MIYCQSSITIIFFWLDITQSSLTTEEEAPEGHFSLFHKHLCLCSRRTRTPFDFSPPPLRESVIQLVVLLSGNGTSHDANRNCFLTASVAFLWVYPPECQGFRVCLPSCHFCCLTNCFLSSVLLGQTQQIGCIVRTS